MKKNWFAKLDMRGMKTSMHISQPLTLDCMINIRLRLMLGVMLF